MLPKQYRLPLRTEFNRLKKEGKLFQGKLCSLLVSHSREAGPRFARQPSRFAFIVSNKIHKKATKRNKIRRLLSEAVWQFLPEIKPGSEGVFLVKKSIIGANYQQIKQEVKVLLQKAQLTI